MRVVLRVVLLRVVRAMMIHGDVRIRVGWSWSWSERCCAVAWTYQYRCSSVVGHSGLGLEQAEPFPLPWIGGAGSGRCLRRGCLRTNLEASLGCSVALCGCGSAMALAHGHGFPSLPFHLLQQPVERSIESMNECM